ncbi:unannotated protein [freshwater metagenome]|uniref:Unannotated protein n=1 Tax=freshwater metagenome TaxID=449393 RepID=A0A6J6IJP6_9ZZZZ
MTQCIGHDATTDLNDAVLRIAGEEPQIAVERERESDPDGVSVHGGDDGFADAPCRRRNRIGTESRRVRSLEHVGSAGEIGTGAERRRRPREHDHAHCVVGIGHSVEVTEGTTHRTAEGVPRVGTVQGGDKHTIVMKFGKKIGGTGIDRSHHHETFLGAAAFTAATVFAIHESEIG